MPTRISIDDRGLATVEIEDKKGWHSYTVRRLRPGLSAWAVEVRRLEPAAIYRVSLEGNGRWRCTCPNWKYRKDHDCKHCDAMRHLRSFLISMETESHVQESHEVGEPVAARPHRSRW